jgi:hypothetical protein
VRLYRPTGLRELHVVLQSGMVAWPPRLPEQTIFYPVTNYGYAAQIASAWNTKSDERAGYVTRFDVSDSYVSRFERRVVGSREHEELWVPAESLDEFNRHLTARIEVVGAFFQEGFEGLVPEDGGLKGLFARAQFRMLACQYAHHLPDFYAEFVVNRDAIFLHYPYWRHEEYDERELCGLTKEEVLLVVRGAWRSLYPELSLPRDADSSVTR